MTVSGLYTTSNGSGAAREQLPLDGVHVAVRIVNLVAEVQVVQFYVNDKNTSIDCVYEFPMDDNAAVCGLEVELNDRLLIGEVCEKTKAREEYSKAVSQGQTAALVEENKPDIFQQRIGNIPPHSRVNVRITYVTELKVDKETGGAIFVLPTSVAPRYSPYGSSAIAFGTRWQDVCFGRRLAYIPGSMYTSVNSLPFSRWTYAIPTFIVDRERPTAFSLTLEAEMPSKVLSVESRTHQLNVVPSTSMANETMAAASLFNEQEPMGKDLEIIIYQEKPFEPSVQLEVLSDGSGCAMMTFVPEFDTERDLMEIVFVVDCSGSMSGTRMAAAKRALGILVQSLPLSCAFNIIRFGNSCSTLFHEPEVYSQTTLNQAKSYIEKTAANMGGTEILRPLKKIVHSQPKWGNSRQVFVLTDGQVANTEEIIQLLRTNAHNTRVFTVGIGDEVSRHLVEGMARATAGTAEFIVGRDLLGQGTGAMDSKLVNQLKLATLPSITKIDVDWLGGTSQQEPKVPEASAPASKFFPTGPRHPGSMMRSGTTTTTSASVHQVGSGQWLNTVPDASFAQPQGRNAALYQAPFLPPPLFSGHKFIMYCFFKPDEMARVSQVNVSALVPGGGDLFLAVPVAKVTSVGRTVHLLGARALVRDLTEGTSHLHFQKSFTQMIRRPYTYSAFSGWLHAPTSDSTSPQDRASAWDLVPIHPPYEIVRREMIEIGTRFGIVSKETSFVAVERWSDGRTGIANQPNPLPFEEVVDSVEPQFHGVSTKLLKRSVGRNCNPPSPPASMSFFGGTLRSSPSPLLSAVGAASPQLQRSNDRESYDLDMVHRKMAVPQSLSSKKAARKATPTSGCYKSEMAEQEKKKTEKTRRFTDARQERFESFSDDDEDHEMGLVYSDGNTECETVVFPAARKVKDLHYVVSVQNFDGSIEANETNAKALGLKSMKDVLALASYQDVRNAIPSALAPRIFFALVFLAILMKRFPSDEDRWTLIAAKTRSWLTNALVQNNKVSPADANQLIEPWLTKTRQCV